MKKIIYCNNSATKCHTPIEGIRYYNTNMFFEWGIISYPGYTKCVVFAIVQFYLKFHSSTASI